MSNPTGKKVPIGVAIGAHVKRPAGDVAKTKPSKPAPHGPGTIDALGRRIAAKRENTA